MLKREAFDDDDNNSSAPIHPQHLTEWSDSSVDEKLTTLNITSLSGIEPRWLQNPARYSENCCCI
ncbi:MAG: hypothetical protein QNJ53_12010 [Pleurocapsa sp. MO_192.B19]|nr:hypothetical protein [Pleurocapsa sp. MO_192.B19]